MRGSRSFHGHQPVSPEQSQSPDVGSTPGVTSQATAVQVEPEVEEVRVAMALNGGVSLAVWMGGCAVELDHAGRRDGARRRSTDLRHALRVLRPAAGDRHPHRLQRRGVKTAVCSARRWSAAGAGLDPNFLPNSWLDLGDLTSLLHGSAEQEPRSLMQGKRFHEGLLGAFDCVLGSGGQEIWREACRPETAERSMVPSLDITMTDTIGVERRFRDAWGGVLRAKEHRPRFRFRRRAHFTAEALADATRTSASFPLAFEPWPVKDAARRLAALPIRPLASTVACSTTRRSARRWN